MQMPIIIIIIIIIAITIAFMQSIYSYNDILKKNMFLGYIVIQLLCVCNLH
jgi:hypothetical protein